MLLWFKHTLDLYLSGLIGMASQPNMQKIRIIGFLFEYWLCWHFDVDKRNSTNGYFRLHIYSRTKQNINTQFLICIWQLGRKLKP